jgi:hypothetical protein
MMFRKLVAGYSRDQVQYKYVAGEALCHLMAQDVVHMLTTAQFFGSSSENHISQLSKKYILYQPPTNLSYLPPTPHPTPTKKLETHQILPDGNCKYKLQQ